MNRILSLLLIGTAALLIYSAALAQESAPPAASPSHILTVKKVHPSLSGENDKTAWDISVAFEPGRAFYSRADIGGSGVSLRGMVEPAPDDTFLVSVKIAESIAGGTAPGPNGQPLAITSQRDIEINVTTTLGQELRAGERPLKNAGQDHPVEVIYITIEPAAEPGQAAAAASATAATSPGDWHINEEAPRKSGLRLLPGQKKPQYLIAFRTEKPADSASPLANINPKVVTLLNEPAKIEIKGPSEAIAIESVIRKDEGGVLDFFSIMTHEQSDTTTTSGNQPQIKATRKTSEKVEREMTLKPGEEKEVGEFMGVKIFVTVTRVE